MILVLWTKRVRMCVVKHKSSLYSLSMVILGVFVWMCVCFHNIFVAISIFFSGGERLIKTLVNFYKCIYASHETHPNIWLPLFYWIVEQVISWGIYIDILLKTNIYCLILKTNKCTFLGKFIPESINVQIENGLFFFTKTWRNMYTNVASIKCILHWAFI